MVCRSGPDAEQGLTQGEALSWLAEQEQEGTPEQGRAAAQGLGHASGRSTLVYPGGL